MCNYRDGFSRDKSGLAILTKPNLCSFPHTIVCRQTPIHFGTPSESYRGIAKSYGHLIPASFRRT